MMNKVQNMNRGGYITSISGMKVVALWMIFLLHSSIVPWGLNPASRCVELFFVASGFLTFYSSEGKEIPCTYRESFNIVCHKLTKVLPLYLVTYLYYFLISRPNIVVALLNLFMLQSWSNSSDVYFSLNGPSWYITTLMFCYFFTPLCIKIVRRSRHSLLGLLAFGIIRMFAEILLVREIISLNVHVAPIIRIFDFVMGMYAASFFLRGKFILKHHGVMASVSEIGFMSGLIILDHFWGLRIPRTVFVCVCCFLCIILANNAGVISKILSCKVLQWFGTIQLEFYLLHAAVGSFVYLILGSGFPILRSNVYIKAGICFVLCTISSLVYKKVFKKKIETWFQIVE